MRRSHGFTLIEVLLAVVLLGLVVGSLVVSVQQNLVALVGARAELEQMRLAETALRELEESAAAGTPPEPGRTQGGFDAPDDGYAWQLVVEPWAVPLPEALLNSPPLSTVFAPAVRNATSMEPSVLRVEYRVYPVEGTPEDGEPFVTLLVAPVPPELAAAASTAAGAARDEAATGAAGAGAGGMGTPGTRTPANPRSLSRSAPGGAQR